MKRFFVFTLMSLFATTSLLLSNPNAYGYKWGGKAKTLFDGVYASTYITTDWDEELETAYAYFCFYVSNDGPGGVKMYSTATAKVFWNGGSNTPPPKKDTAIVEANSTGSIYESFSFKLRDKPRGNGYISAEADLDVRHIPTNVKKSLPTASCTTHFRIL